ncbi:MFS transporter [Paraburkholderia susongensis]|uniref:Predicted arabinose efflux permease, MFS family n=1 Tax=Paraburkholderia susongensis TaxID=1515439 RepID=A0A1X7LXI4_9BURK|nr:MFS transporter [Paraburkholderia susongensis]SMG58565.1 Predicted arabinose efflux permease, MFS family [Paraburkholderia susongensis]
MDAFNQMARADASAGMLERRVQRRTIFAAALGNGLEFFDFTVYSFFAALIGKLYFPASTQLAALMLSLATFGVGFIVRPLGSILIGAYADRAGRKPALTLTVMLMALGTGAIGLAPTYASIGLAAPAIIVCGRLLQGFSAGGEVGTATTFLMESGKRNQGALVSWQMASQGGAVLVGALVAMTLVKTLSPAALEAWGWRVPFVLGLTIGPIGLYLRTFLEDTLPHAARRQRTAGRMPARWLRQIAGGTMIVIGGTGTLYTMVYFLPSYLTMTLGTPASASLAAACVAGLVVLAGSPFAGRLTDRLRSGKTLIYVSSIGTCVLLLPAFHAIRAFPSIYLITGVVALLVALMTLSSPAAFVLILRAFSPDVRATSLGIIYAMGVTLFGGFAQLIVLELWHWSGSFYAPAWYVMGCSAISVIGVFIFNEHDEEDSRPQRD